MVNSPENFDAEITSPYEAYFSWENKDQYHFIQIWENEDEGGWVKVDLIPGYNQSYERSGLDPNTDYCWYVVGEIIEPPGESNPSNMDCETTYAELAAPTNLVLTVISGTAIELVWQDNSSLEDVFCIEEKVGAGSFSEIATVSKNVTYYKRTGLSSSNTYTYRVRARQNPDNYSGYSNEPSAQPYSAPGVPGSLAISEKTDSTMRLTWSASSGQVTGYKIEKSSDGGSSYSEIAKVRAGVHYFLVRDLQPNKQYYFKIRAYGPGGNSNYTSPVNDTTDSSYSWSKFDLFIRNPGMSPIYLVEINPLKIFEDWALVSGKTNTYEVDINDRAIEVNEAWDDGTALSKKTSISDVESNAGSFYCDYYSRKLYVHTTDSTDPNLSLITGAFWLYFTNYHDEENQDPLVFNGHNYLPYIDRTGIPGIRQEIKSLFEPNFSIGTGSVNFMNPVAEGEHYFDKKYAGYIWRNRKLIIKLGRIDFTYSEFKPMFTALINKVSCDDFNFQVQLRDLRKDMKKKLVLNKYTKAEFPNLEDDFVNDAIFKCWGFKDKVVPVPIDWGNKKFKYMDGRSYSVEKVEKNETELTEGTHYYVDTQNSIITIDADYDLGEEDILEVTFIGVVNSALEPVLNGAEIFIDLMVDHYGFSLSELNLDEIYRTKYRNQMDCSVPLYEDTPYEEIIRTLERTVQAYTAPDENGLVAFKAKEVYVSSNSIALQEHQIDNYKEEKETSDLIKTVRVFYNENPQNQEWQYNDQSDPDMDKLYGPGSDQVVEIYSFFYAPYNAEQIGKNYLALLNLPKVTFETSAILYGKKPGDIILYNRSRAYNEEGKAEDVALRLLKVDFNASRTRTTVRAEKMIPAGFEDEFAGFVLDSSWEKHKESANKTITVASGILTIEIKNSVEARWWCSVANEAPKIIRSLNPYELDLTLPITITTKINPYTVNDDTMAGIFIGSQPKSTNGVSDYFAFKFGRYNDGQVGDGLIVQRNCGAYDPLTGAIGTTLPMWYRIKIDENQDITFWYSTDGKTWNQYEDEGSPLVISDYYYDGIKVGLFAKNIDGNENVAAPFEFFKIEEYHE